MTPLQIGQRYFTRDGRSVQIAGITKNYPRIVWSYSGDWYDRDTGAWVRGCDREGNPVVVPTSYRSIVAENPKSLDDELAEILEQPQQTAQV